MATLVGNINIQEFSDLGHLLVGGRLYTYAQGTTTLKVAYTDLAGTIPHTYTNDGTGGQYIALNARGELPASLYLAAGAYDITLKRPDGTTVWSRRAGDIGDLAAAAGASLVGAADGRTVQENLLAPVSTDNAKLSKNGAIFTEYYNTTAGNGTIKVAVGMLGNPEANISVNMDYTDGVHRYYDPSRSAMWLAMGPDNFAMQRAETGVASGDIWTGTGSKYLFGGFYDGRFFINSFLGDNVGTAQVYVRRNVGVASIGGDGDLVLEGSRIFGESAPVLVNAYNAGNVVLASGGGKVSIGTLTAINDCEIATTSSDGSSGVDGVCISDGETAGRMSLNFGVNTAGMYAWLQASKSGTGLKDIRLQPVGGDTYVGGGFFPLADNTQPVGAPSFRWSTIYAGTGTINTSDARDKSAVASFSDAEIAAAKALSQEIGIYQFLASIEAKGEDARRHIGMTVQRAIEIMQGHGLDPFGYGFICHDEWDDLYETVHVNAGEKIKVKREIQRQVTKPRAVNEFEIEIIDGKPVRKSVVRVVDEPMFELVEVLDEEGKAIILHRPAVPAKPGKPAKLDKAGQIIRLATPATEAIPASSKPMTHPVPVMETVTEEVEEDAEPVYETRLVRAAGDKYAFRYDQLNLFIARGIEARLAAIEA